MKSKSGMALPQRAMDDRTLAADAAMKVGVNGSDAPLGAALAREFHKSCEAVFRATDS